MRQTVSRRHSPAVPKIIIKRQKHMNSSKTLSRPTALSSILSETFVFKKNDVLYKIIDGYICRYIVIDAPSASRARVVACDENGDRTSRIFDISTKESDFYKVDVAYTRLRALLIEKMTLAKVS